MTKLRTQNLTHCSDSLVRQLLCIKPGKMSVYF